MAMSSCELHPCILVFAFSLRTPSDRTPSGAATPRTATFMQGLKHRVLRFAGSAVPSRASSPEPSPRGESQVQGQFCDMTDVGCDVMWVVM